MLLFRALLALMAVGLAVEQTIQNSQLSVTYSEAEQVLKLANLPLGFETTKKVLETMKLEWDRLNNNKLGSDLDKSAALDSPHFLLELCLLDENKCNVVESNIDKAVEEYKSYTANLVPYLKECQRRQRDFCGPNKKMPQYSVQEATEMVFAKTETGHGVEEIKAALTQIERCQKEARALLDVCKPAVNKCKTVFQQIADLMLEHTGANLSQYLVHCSEFQAKWCEANTNEGFDFLGMITSSSTSPSSSS